MVLDLTIFERGARSPVTARRLHDLARKTAEAVGTHQPHLTLSVVFVNTKRSLALNRRYRRKQHPADVLSFYYHDETGGVPHGDLLLCPPTIRQKAKDHGRSLADETAILFVHGLLHLYGYDHQRDRDERRMRRLEGVILDSTHRPHQHYGAL